MTSEAFQRVTDNFTGEPFKVSQKFSTTDEAQNFRIKKKKMNYGRQNKFPKTKNRNVLAPKLRPVKDFKNGEQ